MKKIMSIIIILILGVAALSACGQKDTFKESYTEYYSFETTTDLYSLWRNNFYGKMELNIKPEYVTHGNSSAKVTIDFPSLGRNNLTLLATECMPRLTIEINNFSKPIEDVAQYAGVRADVFNANDRDMTLVFYLSNDSQTFIAKHYKIQANSWVNAMLPIGKLDDEALTEAKYIELGFLGNELFEGDTVFYVDNVHLYGKADDIALSEKSFKENEILNFSSHSDVERVNTYWVNKVPYTAVSYNTNQKYSKTNSGSLKLSVLPIAEGEDLLSNTVGDNGRVGFELKKDFLSKVNFNPLHFSQSPSISTDVFNNDKKEHIVYLDIKDSQGGSIRISKTVEPYQWATLQASDLNKIQISSIESIRLTTDLFNVFGSVELYFSNLKMNP